DGGASTFTKGAFRPMVTLCLRWSDAGLFACADEAQDAFTLGVSRDGDEPFVPVLRAGDLAPQSCASDAAGAACASTWCDTRRLLPIDGGCDDRDPRIDAGDAGDAPIGDVAATSGASPPSGCGCRTSRAGTAHALLPVAWGLVA